METRLATEEDFDAILGMQARNHVSVLTDRPATGFLTYACDHATLDSIAKELGVIVCVHEGVIIGYDIMMLVNRALSEPLYRPMVGAYAALRGAAALVGLAVSAQYCVEKGFRGGSVVRKLFAKQMEIMHAKGFTHSVGEIHPANSSSLATVQRMLGYEIVGTYEAEDGTDWVIVGRFETKR